MNIAKYGMMAVALVAATGIFVAGCGKQESTTTEPAASAEPGASAEPAKVIQIAQKTCPIMGGPIDKDVSVDYKGRKVYFCCAACVGKFNKDPEKYIAKVDAQLKK